MWGSERFSVHALVLVERLVLTYVKMKFYTCGEETRQRRSYGTNEAFVHT